MKILAIEPYYGLSHKTFLEGFQEHSSHEVTIWSLPPRKWKWRMRGAAYHFAAKARAGTIPGDFDALFVSDFLNLSDFVALAPAWYRTLPKAVYFHENQITYPLSEKAPADYLYGWINLSTALSADVVFFNSQYHRQSFIAEVRHVLGRMPDHVPESLVEDLLARSRVFPVGIDFSKHDAIGGGVERRTSGAPVIFWNHRWEYDKNPDLFFRGLIELRSQDVPFRLVVCGQEFKSRPAIFDEARETLADRIDHFGFFPSEEDYIRRAYQSDIIVSTATHEFFGVSVIEGIYCGCLPVLPRRLSYPEIIPAHLHPLFLYERDEDFPEFLRRAIEQPPAEYRDELKEQVATYDWRNLAYAMDKQMESLVRQHQH